MVSSSGSWAVVRGSKSDGAAIAFSKHPSGLFRREMGDARIEEGDVGGHVWEEDRSRDSGSKVAVRAEIEPPAGGLRRATVRRAPSGPFSDGPPVPPTLSIAERSPRDQNGVS